MPDTVVRLVSITLNNFKNVQYGKLDFVNQRKDYQTSILGLYGQNGSGKTALIDALELLKLALCSHSIPEKYADYINIEAGYANLLYEFSITRQAESYQAYYQFDLSSREVTPSSNTIAASKQASNYKVAIQNEKISYAYANENLKLRKSTLIDTETDKIFVPLSKYQSLIGKEQAVMLDLLVAKRLAKLESRSFIFSRELLNSIKHRQNEQANISELQKAESKRHLFLLEELAYYGNYELFVINSKNLATFSLQTLPFNVPGKSEKVQACLVSLDEVSSIPKSSLAVFKNLISNMNVLLTQIVPGLSIGIEELGEMLFANGERGVNIQLMSLKNKKAIPICYESDGIKKIISVLQLLIAVYNQSSITVAIDELDAGVFEYLLGELLRIISEKGKGQLIFTSHNLRPLETLDLGFIAFTTTNAKKRYIRLNSLKDSHNLRDFYYRDIILGEQDEEVYDATNNSKIAFAFRKAGEQSGT